jgi:hypothetical protein
VREEEAASVASTHLSMLVADFLARSGDHWVMQRLRYEVGVAAERLAPAIRVREVEDEVEATGTHIGVVASVFLRIQDVNG